MFEALRQRLSAWLGVGLGDDFQKLWAGQTISLFGNQVTAIALPLAAVVVLHASPGQMGILQAAGFLPALVLALAAGVWADRRRRRPLMIWSDLGRVAIIAMVPLVATMGFLRIELLYAVAAAAGILTVVFDTAAFSYLPSLVDRGQLVAANSRLQFSYSLSFLAGPGVGGLLVQLITAPLALVTDALTFVVSAAGVLAIRRREPDREAATADRSMLGEVMEGIRFVFGSCYLRPIALGGAWFNFFGQFVATLYVLYAARELGLAPVLIGITSSSAGIGSVIGSLLVQRASARFGFGRVLVGSMVVGCAPYVLIPVAAGPRAVTVLLLVLAYLAVGLGITASIVQVVSLRQVVAPERLLGRINASHRVLTYGVLPLGALTAGLLGEALGTHVTLLVGAFGILVSPLWIALSSVTALIHPDDAIHPDAAPVTSTS